MALDKMKTFGSQIADAATSRERDEELSARLRDLESKLQDRNSALRRRVNHYDSTLQGWTPATGASQNGEFHDGAMRNRMIQNGSLHKRVENLSHQCNAAMASLEQWKLKTSNLERALVESNERARKLEEELKDTYTAKELLRVMYAKAKNQLERRIRLS